MILQQNTKKKSFSFMFNIFAKNLRAIFIKLDS